MKVLTEHKRNIRLEYIKRLQARQTELRGQKYSYGREEEIKNLCKKLDIPYTPSKKPPKPKYPVHDAAYDRLWQEQEKIKIIIPFKGETAEDIKSYRRREKKRFARKLARRMTPAEKALRLPLKRLGFRPQEVVLGFIPDFSHKDRKVILEVDGGVHLEFDQMTKDRQKDTIFQDRGYKVLRFTNEQVLNNLDVVVKQIQDILENITLEEQAQSR